MRPLVSVCIPAYAQVEYLRKTLDSIACQDFDNYELIVSDDSPDGAVENLLRAYSFRDKLRYWRNPQRCGSPKNWNVAVAQARGEYIKVMHHDDWFVSPRSLREYVKLLDDNPVADFAFSGAIGVSAVSGRTWHHKIARRDGARLRAEPTSLFYGNLIGPPSGTIYRCSLPVTYDERFTWVVDIDFYIHALLSAGEIAFTDAPLIASISAAAHQVTGKCAGNREIEVYEYFSLFEKIRPHMPPKRRSAYVRCLERLVIRHRLHSINEVRECGYRGEIPPEISRLLNWMEKSERLAVAGWHLGLL